MWWWKWACQKRLLKEKVAERGWLGAMERRLMQSLVIKFWKQGWQVTVRAMRLMGVVRERCGQMVAVIEQWRWRAGMVLQDAWEGVQVLEQCVLRMWLHMWKNSKVRKALVINGGLVEDSIAIKYLELVESHGYSFAKAAWKLVEDGEDEKTVLEIGQQIKEYRTRS